MSWVLMDAIIQNGSLHAMPAQQHAPVSSPRQIQAGPASALESFPGCEKLGKEGRLVLRQITAKNSSKQTLLLLGIFQHIQILL